MRVLGLASVAALVLVVALLGCSSEVLAARTPAVLADQATERRGASRPEQPREAEAAAARGDDNASGAATAGLDASRKHAAAGASSPSTVFDPDRMSKRRVRRGSDPIHNKC
ncbi:hypothetical protein ACP70R_009772 [Stipagrostis hirtigluma subsp. patula]